MSKKLSPLRGRPTRKDVAERAGVSQTTVARVYSDDAGESISSKARERVLAAATELGYRPNSAAKALRSGRSGLLGFWMCLELSLYRSRVLAEMRGLLAKTEYTLAVTDVDEDYAWHHSLERALRVPVDGIIAFDASTASHLYLQDTERPTPNLPFVSMGAFWSDVHSYVGVDLASGSRDAVRHLIEMGRRRIVHLAPQGTWFMEAGARLEGYRDAMLAADRAPIVIGIDDHPDRRIESISQALREAEAMPDAVYCFYDEMAMDAIVAIERLGLEPGRDVAIVGVNGSEGLDRLSCPLSTVRQPVEEMCELALRFLRQMIDDPTMAPPQRVLKPELIVRASSDQPAPR